MAYKPTFEDHMRRFAVGDLVTADIWGGGIVLEVTNFYVMGHYFVEFQRRTPRKIWVGPTVRHWVWQWTERMWCQNYELRPATLLDVLAIVSAVRAREVEPDPR